MASELTIFSIYKTQNDDKYFLLRTERPSFSNASQIQEDLADKIEQNKREYILGQIRKNIHKVVKPTLTLLANFKNILLATNCILTTEI